MKRSPKKAKRVSAEAIARLADQGKDVSRFFTNSGLMMEPIHGVNVDNRRGHPGRSRPSDE